jgi:Ca2+-binding RTX toxin-like protein
MAWQIPISTTSTTTVAVPLNTDESVFIAQGVLVASTANSAIHGAGSNHEVIIAGTAAASTLSATVSLGGNFSGDTGNRVTIETGGEVRSFTSYGIFFVSYGNQVINNGLIAGSLGGILLYGVHTGSTTTIVNNGTIASAAIGIGDTFNSTETVTFVNHGTLSAPTAYGIVDGPVAVARDVITNTGHISGKIDLSSGDDTYSGAAGHLVGIVFGGAGIDGITGGADNDHFKGGSGGDTLRGNAGKDLLEGEAGSDTLFGGTGNDKLIGGANNDFFVFNTALNATTNRDIVTDFVHGQDKFQLENAVFSHLGAAGVLKASFFFVGTAAHDADDHIIYNHATGKVFYDSNGDAAGGSTLFAVLTIKPVLTASDFQVV